MQATAYSSSPGLKLNPGFKSTAPSQGPCCCLPGCCCSELKGVTATCPGLLLLLPLLGLLSLLLPLRRVPCRAVPWAASRLVSSCERVDAYIVKLWAWAWLLVAEVGLVGDGCLLLLLFGLLCGLLLLCLAAVLCATSLLLHLPEASTCRVPCTSLQRSRSWSMVSYATENSAEAL